ncbi:MAG: HNH endonuclease [Gammaproteobacteria bacterium]|nr:HNH endonuclease [Gammaproteobacteria bacterium]
MSEIKDTDDVDKLDEVNSEDAETSEVDKELDDYHDEYIEKDKSKVFNYNPDLYKEEDYNKEKLNVSNESKLFKNEDYSKEKLNVLNEVTEKVECRNQDLEGENHRKTGVPFEKRDVELGGKNFEVVVPKFESSFDAQLPEDKYKDTDQKQFKECNNQLKSEIENNEKLREKFTPEGLKKIEQEKTPRGYTWHHDAEEGKMQLVDSYKHRYTNHTGGRQFWGGGKENR